MSKFIIEASGQDAHGRNVPNLIGTFDSRKEASDFAADIIANGSWTVGRLTGPAFARSLANQPPKEQLDDDILAWQRQMRDTHHCEQDTCTHAFND